MTGAAILVAAALLGSSGRAPGIAFRPISPDDAIAYFKRICVDTMPNPSVFAAALNAEPAGWVAFQKRDRGTVILGHFWRSEQGELFYQNLPEMTVLETNPGCHYSFRNGPDYSHDEAARAVARALGLDGGRQTGKKKAPQTRWEGALPNGTRIRIFLSSVVRDMDGPASTLSVSAYRDARRGR
jgi:hypothetical protein